MRVSESARNQDLQDKLTDLSITDILRESRNRVQDKIFTEKSRSTVLRVAQSRVNVGEQFIQIRQEHKNDDQKQEVVVQFNGTDKPKATKENGPVFRVN